MKISTPWLDDLYIFSKYAPANPEMKVAVNTAKRPRDVPPPLADATTRSAPPLAFTNIIPTTGVISAKHCLRVILEFKSKTENKALVKILLCEHTMYIVGLNNRTALKKIILNGVQRPRQAARAVGAQIPHGEIAAPFPCVFVNRAQLTMNFSDSEHATTVETRYGVSRRVKRKT